jgi:ArsR family metal-binding transcriptional regulator
MRYDFTVANTSNVALESYYWHDRIPTDAARATIFTTGTYSARLNYRILYKTNYSATYQVLASNLITNSSYSFSLNAIPMQAGEYVTDIYLDFGKVPVGFQSTSNPTLTVQVLGTVANGYQIINRADAGGKYQGTWQTAQAAWVTIVHKLTTNPTLPKTGY